MRVDVLTIFPEYLAPLELSLVGKARAAGLLDVRVHDLRDWTTDRHRTVDDTPFGGGAGMVMRPDVWGVALDEVLGLGPADDAPGEPGAAAAGGPDPDVPVGAAPEPGAPEPAAPEPGAPEPAALPVLLVPTPSGRPFDQAFAVELARYPHLVLACGRYEGIDARVVEHYATRVHVEEVSLGDYVLNGGEVAALAIIEAVARLLPGVVGNPHSLVEESHGDSGLLEYPVFTKPAQWRGHAVPEELLSGHHARIARWRRDQALRRTAERRPDLVARLDVQQLDAHDRAVLAGLGWVVHDGALTLDPGVSAQPDHVAD